jgi:hypothetical protein
MGRKLGSGVLGGGVESQDRKGGMGPRGGMAAVLACQVMHAVGAAHRWRPLGARCPLLAPAAAPAFPKTHEPRAPIRPLLPPTPPLKGIPVRVTRKNIDAGSFAGAIFVYDGLYNVVGGVEWGGGWGGGWGGMGQRLGRSWIQVCEGAGLRQPRPVHALG